MFKKISYIGDFKASIESRDDIHTDFETGYDDLSSRFVTQQHQPTSSTNNDTILKTNQTENWNVNHTQASQAAPEENMQIEGLDEELGTYFGPRSAVIENDENQTLKLSQLRQLLEKNLQPTISPTMNMASTNSAFKPAIKPEPPVVGSWSPYNVTSGTALPLQPASSVRKYFDLLLQPIVSHVKWIH